MPEETLTGSVLVVVLDANMLIHGKALPDLPWAELGREDIEVLYVPSVIREIDALKVQSGRPNKLARKVSEEVRALRASNSRSGIVREHSPRVTKRLALKPVTKKFHKSLKLDHADQALINTCLALKAEGNDVLLITNDTICATTADEVGLRALLVDDHWLRDPEPDERDRENARLKAQVQRLSAAEPEIDIQFSGTDGQPITALEAELTIWPALTGEQVDELLARVESGCPTATSFEQPKELAHAKLMRELTQLYALGPRSIYTPATEAEIDAYKTKRYPRWLDQVRDKLDRLHELLEQRTVSPRIQVRTSNVGTRPAEGVLIKVQPRGELSIENLDGGDEEDDDPRDERASLILPLPPAPPRGKTETVNPFDFGSGIDRAAALSLGRPIGLPHMPAPRRPDRFYWRRGEEGPTDLFELECTSWRHAESQIKFTIGVRPHAFKDTQGVVEFTVHAANLSQPRTAALPVRLSTSPGSTIDKASRLVDSLIHCAKVEKLL